MWDSKEKTLTDSVLRSFDDVLAEKVYKIGNCETPEYITRNLSKGG